MATYGDNRFEISLENRSNFENFMFKQKFGVDSYMSNDL